MSAAKGCVYINKVLSSYVYKSLSFEGLFHANRLAGTYVASLDAVQFTQFLHGSSVLGCQSGKRLSLFDGHALRLLGTCFPLFPLCHDRLSSFARSVVFAHSHLAPSVLL